MSGYVVKSDVLSVTRILQSKMDNSGARALENVIGAVEDMVEADAVPVVHGHWIDTGSGQECSVCGEIQYGYDSGRFFCQKCGAKMDEKMDDVTE